jgi:hypothetical protein
MEAEEESGGEKAPLWIISFADMISLLMAFFVMLQTLATEQTNELLTTGQGRFKATMGEFKRTINAFGMPGLFGDSVRVSSFDGGGMQRRFDVPSHEEVTSRAVSGEEETLLRNFTSLSQAARTERPQLAGRIQDYVVMPIGFVAGTEQLDAETTSRLTQYATAVSHAGASQEAIVYYVVGAAPDVPSVSQQWIVSERRAQTVTGVLREMLPGEKMHWWGAGAGGSWFPSGTQGQNHVLIATVVSSP